MNQVARLGAVVCAVGLWATGCGNENNDKPVELSPVTTTVRTVEPLPTAGPTRIITINPEQPGKSTQTKTTTAQTKTSSSGKSGSAANSKSTKELVIQDIQKGQGTEAKPGDTIQVHYRGTLLNGEKFDASYDRGEPFTFQLGGGQVIKGWDQGFNGMKVGGKRKLTVPPHLAYGAQSPSPTIPPNSTLVFEVELLQVMKR